MTGIELCGRVIPAGTRATLDLPLPALYTHTQVSMPVRVLCGREAGPRLLVSAALHGDEINGVEIIRRLLALPLLRRLRGVLIAVPVINVYGLISHSRYLPDRRDLNRSFPGSETGSLTARLAHLFLHELLAHAGYLIDLHTGALHRANLPQIRADLTLPGTLELAQAFGTPVILDSPAPAGTLRQAAAARGITAILYEGGEALRFDELAIRAGVRGVVAALRQLGMLPGSLPLTRPVIARASGWVRAPQSGIMRTVKPLGARVAENEELAWISDPFGENESVARARYAGLIIGRTHLPLVNEGEALFHIAQVARPGEVEKDVGRYHEALAETVELADPTDSDDRAG